MRPLIPLVLILALACSKPVPVPSPVPTPPAPVAAAADAPTLSPVAPRRRVLDAPLWTQTIAVLDTKVQITAPETFTEDLAPAVTEQVEGAFLATGRFELVERARLGVVHDEMSNTSDALWFDQRTVASMGKGLGARLIVLPSIRVNIGALNTRMDLQIKVLDVETGSIVQTFVARTNSASASLHGSVTACLGRIRASLQEAITPAYPAQAVIVHSPTPGVFWAEAKQVTQFAPGMKVRFLRNEDVFNPITGTSAPFTSEAGRGRIQSVSPQGIVIMASIKAEPGWIIEVLH